MKRYFIALDFDDEFLEYLQSMQKAIQSDSAKLSFPKGLHITLSFIGNTDDRTISMIAEKLKAYPSFSISTTGLGYFPDKKNPRVIWLGIKDNPAIKDIHKDITKVTETVRKSDHDSFIPHITLARVKNIFDKSDFRKNIGSHKVKQKDTIIRSYSLYNSNLTPKGPEYKKIRTITLS